MRPARRSKRICGFPGRGPDSSFAPGVPSGSRRGGVTVEGNGDTGGPWRYDTYNDQVPDKNDIVNAFAAAYEVE